MDQVKAINVPMYDELSIKNLLPMMMEEPMFRTYVPDSFPKGRQIDRTYFFNIMNTLNPEYTQAIIKYAEEQRHSAATVNNAEQTMQVSEAWWNALQSQPFISRKYFFS